MTPQDWNAQEGIYAFIGWLTTRRKPITMSSTHDAGEPCDLIGEFCHRHGLSLTDGMRDGWERAIVPEANSASPQPGKEPK